MTDDTKKPEGTKQELALAEHIKRLEDNILALAQLGQAHGSKLRTDREVLESIEARLNTLSQQVAALTAEVKKVSPTPSP